MNSDFSLAEQNIVVCKKGTPPLNGEKIYELLALLPQWHVEASIDGTQPMGASRSAVEVENETGIKQLVRKYQFADYAEAVQFGTYIKAMADEANHHPSLHAEGNLLTMRWWTHSISGLHLNDFIMAARSDELYRNNLRL